jgi:hypothetical protein
MRPPLHPAGVVLAALWILSGGTALATVVNGRVTTTTGQGIANVDLDFIDRNTNISIPLTNDRTDVLGFYAVSVPPGSYDVRFKPPLGTRFVGEEIRGIDVQGNSLVLDQVLQTGWMITGRAIDDLANPAASVDLDVIDAPSGDQVFTNHDTSDLSGNFNVVVPTGTYHIEFEPPRITNLVPRRMETVAVAADLALGDVVLIHGFHLSGDVLAPDASAVPDGTIRAFDPVTGREVFTPANKTDGAGHFDLLVAPGAYNLRIEPPRGTRSLPRTVAGVSVSADRALPPVILDAGVTAFGRVEDTFGNRTEGVDLDFVNAFSGVKQFTPHDNTDENGEYAVTVRPGTYDIAFDPQAGSGLAPQRLSGVIMAGDQSLPDVTLPPGFLVSGTVRDAASNPIAGVDLDLIDLAAGLQIYTARDDTDLAGAFAVIVPAGAYDIRFTPPGGGGLGLAALNNVTVGSDLSLGMVIPPPSFPALPAAISPPSGSALGGILVTVTGSDFAPGAVVRVGGVTLSGIVRLDSGTIQGTTRPRPAGVVDVEVINPGAAPAVLPGAFTYLPPAADPTLTVSVSGPVGTDILLEWTSTGQARYTVFRSSSPNRFGDTERIEVIEGTSFRDEGAMARPGTFFYLVQ